MLWMTCAQHRAALPLIALRNDLDPANVVSMKPIPTKG
jgi:hypothetical protein